MRASPVAGPGACKAQALRSAAPQRLAAARRSLQCRASAQAEDLLTKGRAKYDGGDRMGALRFWEQALDKEPTQEQRLVALFNAACVHASFGDLELAQIPLKDALYGGLDFQAAMAQQDARFVKLRASAQVLIQLRRFSEQVQRTRAAAPSAPPAYARSGRGASSSSSESRGGGGKGILGRDMSEALSTDAETIDASIGGIIKRVLVLLLALTGLGTALFYLGLKYAFVDSPY
ncbi:hypothetical protein D9Q98_000969 [Chlorella vulgaris]|uniref:Uncharacterized protein n=1 Tax=Chlorella vulgaris TaxID=3077 RepID=A0A9D4U0E6_CHLVU|nr:hypothetical protein D9Q98_000969 [Chlorella vulgaris]